MYVEFTASLTVSPSHSGQRAADETQEAVVDALGPVKVTVWKVKCELVLVFLTLVYANVGNRLGLVAGALTAVPVTTGKKAVYPGISCGKTSLPFASSQLP